MKKLFYIVLIVSVGSCSQKINYCQAHRFDLVQDFVCKKGNDSFYFHVWLNPEPIEASYPQIIIDSIKTINARGYNMRALNYFIISRVPCNECEKIYKIDSRNQCIAFY